MTRSVRCLGPDNTEVSLAMPADSPPDRNQPDLRTSRLLNLFTSSPTYPLWNRWLTAQILFPTQAGTCLHPARFQGYSLGSEKCLSFTSLPLCLSLRSVST